MGGNYSIIRSRNQLKEGDHISWPFNIPFWYRIILFRSQLRHEAIVVSPSVGDRMTRVCHARQLNSEESLPSGAVSSFGSAKSHVVCEEDIDLHALMEALELRRYDYAPSECLSPEEAIDNCRSKINVPFVFCALFNNCKHFAKWCKTGKK